MTRGQTLARLRDLQRRVRALRRATASPTVERTMQTLELYCHMALWELGDVDRLSPEADGPQAAGRARGGARRKSARRRSR